MKKFLCVFLCAILLCTTVIPVFAKDECDCGYSPVIYVAALGSATLYLDADTENEKILFRPETETYLKLVGDLLLPIAKLTADKDYDAFGDSLIAGVDSVFGMLKMDENGDSTDRVTTKETLPTDPSHGVNQSYYFGYDLREDPLTVADKLYEYIEHVKKITGHDSVLLRASSMGGVMTMAYFYKYGTKGIDACIFQCCPIQGTAVAGDLFTKQMKIDPDALLRYASQLPLDEQWQTGLLNGVLNLLYKCGVFHALTDIADDLLAELMDRVFDEFMYPVFGSMPGIWSFVPHNNYELAKSMVFDENVSSKLISRLDEYHYNVQCRAGEILRKAQANGVKIMIVAGYNEQRTPLVVSDNANSDATVDATYASVGGTVADLGSTLPENYKQKKTACNHSHLCVDGVVDASTCALPENTWFIRDMLHSTTHDGHGEFYNLFFYTDEVNDVHANEKYPQFMQNDTVNQTFIPMETIPLKENVKADSDEQITNQTEKENETEAFEEIEIVNAQTGSGENLSLIFTVTTVSCVFLVLTVFFKKRKTAK